MKVQNWMGNHMVRGFYMQNVTKFSKENSKTGKCIKVHFFQKSGRWFEGTFKDGKPWNAKEICPEGGHLYDFKEGRKLAVN